MDAEDLYRPEVSGIRVVEVVSFAGVASGSVIEVGADASDEQ